MRNLITSLQNHNQQLKGEIQRYKRKLKEAHSDMAKVNTRYILYYTTLQYYTILYYTVVYCTVLQEEAHGGPLRHGKGKHTLYTILYYTTVLHYTILYCGILYCTTRGSSWRPTQTWQR